jgi:ribosomal protein L32
VETPEREFVRACPSCGRTGCAHRRQVLYCGSCVTWQGRNEDTRFVWFRNGELLPGPHLSFCPECDVTRLRYSQSDGGVCACGDRLEWVGPVSERGRVENSPLLESIDFTAL